MLETNATTCTRVSLKVQLRIPSFSVTKSSRGWRPRCTRTTGFHTGWAVELLLLRLRVIPDLSLYLRNDQFVGRLSWDETALCSTCKQQGFSIIRRQFLTFSLYIMSGSPIMMDTTTWKSFKAGFLGVPAQLRDARTDFSRSLSIRLETNEPTDLPVVQSCPVTVSNSI